MLLASRRGAGGRPVVVGVGCSAGTLPPSRAGAPPNQNYSWPAKGHIPFRRRKLKAAAIRSRPSIPRFPPLLPSLVYTAPADVGHCLVPFLLVRYSLSQAIVLSHETTFSHCVELEQNGSNHVLSSGRSHKVLLVTSSSRPPQKWEVQRCARHRRLTTRGVLKAPFNGDVGTPDKHNSETALTSFRLSSLSQAKPTSHA
ncbi:uncharacterized protein HMPREF1120_05277 [Exophiala dermatitidis NIH/UT8656]|uniref:Uncharacterized protein n=1 Tax=Exophiala dermatitidis (strain ATCC 34100 / CBS 525.76 / NIH/UT8656) TaxID=858893 RepID=H6C0D6_EXODN|nr:uncharacterized protein HMPREF1120_05277 [Exophiala dermatitidis NIH/UT8656]EHY57231.1 hypothetical protein HMPREF1120_05277 [Exophiala dermatitidis NIH/UT8656]